MQHGPFLPPVNERPAFPFENNMKGFEELIGTMKARLKQAVLQAKSEVPPLTPDFEQRMHNLSRREILIQMLGEFGSRDGESAFTFGTLLEAKPTQISSVVAVTGNSIESIVYEATTELLTPPTALSDFREQVHHLKHIELPKKTVVLPSIPKVHLWNLEAFDPLKFETRELQPVVLPENDSSILRHEMKIEDLAKEVASSSELPEMRVLLHSDPASPRIISVFTQRPITATALLRQYLLPRHWPQRPKSFRIDRMTTALLEHYEPEPVETYYFTLDEEGGFCADDIEELRCNILSYRTIHTSLFADIQRMESSKVLLRLYAMKPEFVPWQDNDDGEDGEKVPV